MFQWLPGFDGTYLALLVQTTWITLHEIHQTLGDNTAVPFRRAGVLLYSQPFSSHILPLSTPLPSQS